MFTLIKDKGINLYTALAVLVAPLAIAAVFFMNSASAAAVTVTLTPNSINGAGANEVTISFAASAEFAASDTIGISFSPSLSGAVSNCATATTSVGGGAGTFGSFSASGATYTFSGASSTATTSSSLCLTVPATTQASYSVSVLTSTGDFGASLLYVTDDNDVLVTAEIVPTLSFNIRDLADSADTNVCDLGTVNTTTTPNTDGTDDGDGECGYSLAVGTNATGGFQVQIDADAALNNVSSSIVDAAEDAAIAAGTEAYGLVHVNAAQTGRDTGSGLYNVTITEDGNFADDASFTPVPTAATNFVSYTDGIQYVAGTDALDTTRVMHGITVAAGTPSGYYDQLVTYTVTATF